MTSAIHFDQCPDVTLRLSVMKSSGRADQGHDGSHDRPQRRCRPGSWRARPAGDIVLRASVARMEKIVDTNKLLAGRMETSQTDDEQFD